MANSSDNSAILTLPYIQPSQAQKHVTHNAALATLDVLVQLSVVGFDATTPPVDPVEGETHALGNSPTNAWAGQDDSLATWQDGIWVFIAPLTGWRAYGMSEAELRIWDGTAWALPVAAQDNLDGLGINTTHDAINRLAVSADATLLGHDGTDHQLKVNKASTIDTASLLFQSAFTGHAEMGLSGNIDFAIKVSDDGITWNNALRIDAATGKIGLDVAAPEEMLHLNGNMLLGNADYIKWDDSLGNAQLVLRVDGSDNVTMRGAGGVRALNVQDSAGSPVLVVRDSGRIGVGTTTPSQTLSVMTNEDITVTSFRSKHASFSGTALKVRADRAGSNAFNLATFSSLNNADLEFKFSGNGNGTCDGSWSGGGADYAEYFEWSDGNPKLEDRRGLAVVLKGDEIREAKQGEAPIGVISGNPSVVGDAAPFRWKGKYLRDDFGTVLLEAYNTVSWVGLLTERDEDGQEITREVPHSYDVNALPDGVIPPKDATYEVQQRRAPNPDYDPDHPYTPRSARAEWDTVGLIGKLRLRKGQVTGAGWVKMRDVSDTVEEWLVR